MSLVSHPNGLTAYGVDGCPGGWLVVALHSSGRSDWFVAASIADIVAVAGESDRVFVDIPIGLPRDARERNCDLAARAALKAPRASCVFRAPVRAVFAARDHEHAGDISAEIPGKRLSRQTWAIVPKIAEVDNLLRHCDKARRIVREVHPELCFWGLAGTPMPNGKKTGVGFQERLGILTRLWPAARRFVDGVLHDTRRRDVGRDDVLDAVVAALVAAQPESELRCMPRRPETDEAGLPMEMVFARGPDNQEADDDVNPATTLPAPLVGEGVQEAKALGGWIHSRVAGRRLPGDDRHRVGIALLQHSEDLTDGTIVLLESGLPGPALALARPLFEAYVRGVWALYCADDNQIEGFVESGRPTPWRLADLIDVLKEKAPEEGEWVSAQARQIPVLNDLAHGGRLHVLDRNTSRTIEPGYDSRDLETLVQIGIELRIRISAELLSLLADEAGMEELQQIAARFDRRQVGAGD